MFYINMYMAHPNKPPTKLPITIMIGTFRHKKNTPSQTFISYQLFGSILS